MTDPTLGPLPPVPPGGFPRRNPGVPADVVNYIRERFHCDGIPCPQIARELDATFQVTLSNGYVYNVAIGIKRRNVPLSQRFLVWLERTGHSRAIAGL